MGSIIEVGAAIRRQGIGLEFFVPCWEAGEIRPPGGSVIHYRGLAWFCFAVFIKYGWGKDAV